METKKLLTYAIVLVIIMLGISNIVMYNICKENNRLRNAPEVVKDILAVN